MENRLMELAGHRLERAALRLSLIDRYCSYLLMTMMICNFILIVRTSCDWGVLSSDLVHLQTFAKSRFQSWRKNKVTGLALYFLYYNKSYQISESIESWRWIRVACSEVWSVYPIMIPAATATFVFHGTFRIRNQHVKHFKIQKTGCWD